jgi:hypothetical protein
MKSPMRSWGRPRPRWCSWSAPSRPPNTLTRFAAELRTLAGEEQKLGLDKRSDYALALATAARDPGTNRFRH